MRDRQGLADADRSTETQSSDLHPILVKSLCTQCPMSCQSTAIKSVSVKSPWSKPNLSAKRVFEKLALANPFDIKSGSVRIRNS